MSKVMIGTVTYHGKDYCRHEFLDHREFIEDVVIQEVWTDGYEGKSSRDRITEGYNELLKKFLESDCTHLLTLEADILPKLCVVEELLRHDLDVVGAMYTVGPKKSRYPCAFTGEKVRIRHPATGKSRMSIQSIEWRDVTSGEVIEAKGGCGLGCCLIKREVLEAIGEFRFGEAHCDMYFHEDVYKKGFKTFVDTGLYCKHRGTWEEWTEVIARNDF